jgi:hypothetical protein
MWGLKYIGYHFFCRKNLKSIGATRSCPNLGYLCKNLQVRSDESFPLWPNSWRGAFPEPVFLDLLRSPGIDSQPGEPVRQPYLSYRPARRHRLPESIYRNRFLGSINVYKYGLCTFSSIQRNILLLDNKAFYRLWLNVQLTTCWVIVLRSIHRCIKAHFWRYFDEIISSHHVLPSLLSLECFRSLRCEKKLILWPPWLSKNQMAMS